MSGKDIQINLNTEICIGHEATKTISELIKTKYDSPYTYDFNRSSQKIKNIDYFPDETLLKLRTADDTKRKGHKHYTIEAKTN